MKRLIESKLIKWKQSKRRKPIILRGARQVGKTWTIKNFGEKHFDNIAVIDLERNTDWHKVFEGNLQARRICSDLEIISNQKIVPGKTLLFFDEIQSCPRALSALRYFYEELPELHVIAAGSLLEFALKDFTFPVGRVQFLHLSPLGFAEFLMANQHEEAANIIFSPPAKVTETVHNFLCDQLRRYFFIGGMPESVKAFIETGSMRESFEVQEEICETYRMDFAKYRPQVDKYCLNNVLSAVTRSVGQQIKYSKLGDGYSNPTLKKAFELLCLANIIYKVPSINPSGLPLGATASSKIFKAILLDIGLMQHLSGMPVDLEYQNSELLNIYRGAMAEQFVGQEMLVSRKEDLYYWARRAKSSSAEVDYVSVINGKIYPVEVKSGSAGRLKSLHLFLKDYKNSKMGIVFSSRPYQEMPEKNILFLPLYFAFSFCHSFS